MNVVTAIPSALEQGFDASTRHAYREIERLSGKIVVEGRLCDALTHDTFPIENPADESELGFAASCGAADVDRAVTVARRAFDHWSRIPARQRGDYLRRAADALEVERESLARLLCLETGNALTTQARPEIDAMLELIWLFAGVATELKGRAVPWQPGQLCYTTRDPIGVVAAIIPWNAPLFLTAAKLGPSLAAGNTVVLKPAEQAPLAVIRCLEILQQVFPPGVANLITGFGEEAGKPLAEHKLVRKVTFTGSSAVGKAILHYAADKLCPVTLELGGKSSEHSSAGCGSRPGHSWNIDRHAIYATGAILLCRHAHSDTRGSLRHRRGPTRHCSWKAAPGQSNRREHRGRRDHLERAV